MVFLITLSQQSSLTILKYLDLCLLNTTEKTGVLFHDEVLAQQNDTIKDKIVF